MKSHTLIALGIIALSTASCKKNTFCTEEYRSFVVSIRDAQGNEIMPDDFYLLQGSDTIRSKATYQHDPWAGGNAIQLFSDSDMKYTDKKGKTFRFTGYMSGNQVFDEAYVFKHDDCHFEKVSGKEIIQLQ